jgi:hypothetical protein
MKYFNKLMIFFSILILIGCKYVVNIPIENKEINGYFGFNGVNVFEIYEDELDYIIISGFIGKDVYNFKNIKTENNSQNKYIIMNAELRVFNRSGSHKFNIKIPIEKNINYVYFGNNQLIWERKSIEKLNNREKLLELIKYTHCDDIIKQFGKPDDIPGGYSIYYYTLNNNRRAVLNFIDGGGRLLKLTEEIFYEGGRIQNIIFD